MSAHRSARLMSLLALSLLAPGCLVGFVNKAELGYVVRGQGPEDAEFVGERRREAVSRIEDRGLAFTFDVSDRRIRLELRNGTGHLLHLDGEAARLVDEDGIERELLVSSRRLRESPVAPLPAGGRQVVFLVRRDAIRPQPDATGFWATGPLLEGGVIIDETSRAGALAKGRKHLGRHFDLVLPLRVGDQSRTYRFRFTVDGVQVHRTTWA